MEYDPKCLDIWSLGVVLAEFLLVTKADSPSTSVSGGSSGSGSSQGSRSSTSGQSEDPLDSHRPLKSELSTAEIDYVRSHRRTLFNDSFGDIGLAASIFRLLGSPVYSWPVRLWRKTRLIGRSFLLYQTQKKSTLTTFPLGSLRRCSCATMKMPS